MRDAGITALAALLGLSACAEPTGSVVTPAGVLSAATVRANAQPLGSARLSLDQAAFEFQDICVETLPRFEGAEAVLRQKGYSQSPATGTWSSPRGESSASLTPQGGRPVCSFIFAATEDPAVLGIALTTATSLGGGGEPSMGMDPASGAATTTTASGAVRRFEPRVGGRPDLHRAVVVAPR